MRDWEAEKMDQLVEEYNAAVANGLILRARLIARRIKYLEGDRHAVNSARGRKIVEKDDA